MINWLAAHGAARRKAVEEAASLLLAVYNDKWPRRVPTDLYGLADSLDVRIKHVSRLEGYGRLIPMSGGFLVLIDQDLIYNGELSAKGRTTIGHELGHTLFYSRDGVTPRRLIEATKAEEHFCFDVARSLLAPRWMLEATKVTTLNDPRAIFDKLVDRLWLSRPVAASVMLADYQLVTGVAGRWTRSSGVWELGRGQAYASPTLDKKRRGILREKARRWLVDGARPQEAEGVFGSMEASGQNAFVVAVSSTDGPSDVSATTRDDGVGLPAR